MNGEDFYGLVPGAMGTLQFVVRQPVTDDQMSRAQDSIASGMFSSYLANYQHLAGEERVDPLTAFTRARQKAMQAAEDAIGTRLENMHVQVGQAESVQHMLEIERSDRFVRWVNQPLADMIKTSI